MTATYLVDGEEVDLDTAREVFAERQLEELAAACALVVLRENREPAQT